MSSLDQIDKEYKLEPIVQPKLDIEAIEIPENGPMSFEMDVEVRPQFDLPSYKGLKVKRPIAELTEKDVDDHLNRFLEGRGTIVPKLEGNAEIGDYIIGRLDVPRPRWRAARRAEGGPVPPSIRASFPERHDHRRGQLRSLGPPGAKLARSMPSSARPSKTPNCGARPFA